MQIFNNDASFDNVYTVYWNTWIFLVSTMYARRMCSTIFVFFFFYKNITIFIASSIASLLRSLIHQLSLMIILIVRVIKFIRIYLVPSSKDKKDRHLTKQYISLDDIQILRILLSCKNNMRWRIEEDYISI